MPHSKPSQPSLGYNWNFNIDRPGTKFCTGFETILKLDWGSQLQSYAHPKQNLFCARHIAQVTIIFLSSSFDRSKNSFLNLSHRSPPSWAALKQNPKLNLTPFSNAWIIQLHVQSDMQQNQKWTLMPFFNHKCGSHLQAWAD